MKPTAAAGTESKPPSAAASEIEDLVFGKSLRSSKKIPYPAQTPKTPMLKTLRPMAVRPPSANKKPCINKTTVSAKVAAQGPTKTAAKAPPSKWPLVPATTGKLSICTAKIKTAVRPARGAVFSSS